MGFVDVALTLCENWREMSVKKNLLARIEVWKKKVCNGTERSGRVRVFECDTVFWGRFGGKIFGRRALKLQHAAGSSFFTGRERLMNPWLFKLRADDDAEAEAVVITNEACFDTQINSLEKALATAANTAYLSSVVESDVGFERLFWSEKMVEEAPTLESLTILVQDLGSQLQSIFRTHAVALNDLGLLAWKIPRPILVTVEQRASDDFVACFYDADVYGYGDSIPGSLEDLKERLVSQYEFLLEESQRVELGPAMAEQLLVLQRVIERGNGHA